MTFQGNLEAIGLFDVFQNVAHNMLTGTLFVQSGTDERWIYFARGKVRFASAGRGVGLPMREFLVRRAYVREADLADAERRHRRGRPALRNVLAKEDLLTETDFAAAFTERVVEFLYETFGLKDATFEFREGDPPERVFDREQRGVELALDAMPVLMEAARREDEWQRIRKVVGSERDLFVRLGDAAPSDDPDLRMVWSCLDGKTDLGEIEMALPLGRFELHEAISRLVAEGLARPVGAAEIVAQAEAAMQNGDHAQTRSLLEHAIQIERNNRDLRRMLAELYEAIDDPRQAAETWAILGYQAAIERKDDEALAAYQRAIDLDPLDLGLREKAFELRERVGSTQDFAAAVLELARLFLEHGLVDRARSVLTRGMERPDLADRTELLERLAEIERDSGRPEEGVRRLVHAAETSHKLGDRQRAELLLEVGLRLFPDSSELRGRLDDVRTNRRENRRRRVRRFSGLVVLGAFAATSAFVAFDEITLRRDMEALLREIPTAVSSGRASETLGAALATWRKHPFTPSRRLFSELAAGLEEAELLAIRGAAADGSYQEALARLGALRALVGETAALQRIDALRQRLEHQHAVHRALAAWFTTARRDSGRSLRAFEFGARDARQVLGLYPRLGDAGRSHARRRFEELATPVALPLFTSRYLDGTADQAHLTELVGTLSDRARDPRWRSQRDVRDAFVAAWMQIAEACLGGGAQRRRALQLMPKFRDRPNPLPETREGFLRLVTGER